MQVELLLDSRAAIGEAPTWSPAEQALYWLDIKQPGLHRRDASGTLRNWRFDSDIGAFALTEEGSAVVALRDGLFHCALDSGALTLLAPPPFDSELFRFNEGICDAAGRFWIGVMFDPRPGIAASPRPAPLHCFTFATGLRAAADEADLHNGAAWSADGRTLFLAHSNAGAIYRYDYDPTLGRLGQRTPFISLQAPGQVPDGAAMDAEGCYWCAIHGGGALHRYGPAGNLLAEIKLPVSQPTMCAFTGAALDEMVVTSARDGLTPGQLAQEPQAGGLFRLRPGVRGIPRPCIVR